MKIYMVSLLHRATINKYSKAILFATDAQYGNTKKITRSWLQGIWWADSTFFTIDSVYLVDAHNQLDFNKIPLIQ